MNILLITIIIGLSLGILYYWVMIKRLQKNKIISNNQNRVYWERVVLNVVRLYNTKNEIKQSKDASVYAENQEFIDI
jgi:hypothetical protein